MTTKPACARHTNYPARPRQRPRGQTGQFRHDFPYGKVEADGPSGWSPPEPSAWQGPALPPKPESFGSRAPHCTPWRAGHRPRMTRKELPASFLFAGLPKRRVPEGWPGDAAPPARCPYRMKTTRIRAFDGGPLTRATLANRRRCDSQILFMHILQCTHILLTDVPVLFTRII